MQLAIEAPALVHSLVLLEPPLMSVPSASAFFDKAGPALAAFQSGDCEGAMVKFLSMVASLDPQTCRTVLEATVPGGLAQAMKDADNFFAGYLAALGEWQFGQPQAATIDKPVLSVLGTKTEQLFVDSHELLHAWFPRLDDCTIEGVGHLLHMQHPAPVVAGVSAWLSRHPIS